jgi:hypothetical protein
VIALAGFSIDLQSGVAVNDTKGISIPMGTPGASVLVLHITNAYLFIGVDGTIDKAGYADVDAFLDDLEDAGAVGFYVNNANLDSPSSASGRPCQEMGRRGGEHRAWSRAAGRLQRSQDLQLLGLPAVGGSLIELGAPAPTRGRLQPEPSALSLLDNSGQSLHRLHRDRELRLRGGSIAAKEDAFVDNRQRPCPRPDVGALDRRRRRARVRGHRRRRH